MVSFVEMDGEQKEEESKVEGFSNFSSPGNLSAREIEETEHSGRTKNVLSF